MKVTKIILLLAVAWLSLTSLTTHNACHSKATATASTVPSQQPTQPAGEQASTEVVLGAARTSEYVPLLKGKRVALLSNQTGMVGDKHTLDLMLENGVNVVTIFSPEHGFRGNADICLWGVGKHVAPICDHAAAAVADTVLPGDPGKCEQLFGAASDKGDIKIGKPAVVSDQIGKSRKGKKQCARMKLARTS